MGFSTTAESASCFFFSAWKKLASWDKSRKRRQNQDWAFMEELCRRFSLAEIRAATECFNDKFHIGSGPMSSVYKGYINGGATVVAIKRFTGSKQNFRNEVLLSCQLRHPNLLPVIGFCEEKEELILVYDYMARGALSSQLFKRADLDPLPWRQRLNICIGVARALHYLHAGLKHAIVHRDVKCSVILLDERFEAKVSNLLTFKMGPPSLSNKVIRVTSDRIVGTFGYIDPEYIHLEQFTEKSDVYSFGMVLLEVFTAKWAKEFNTYIGRPDTLCDIMDRSLKGKIAPDCLQKFMDIVYRCVSPTGAERPLVGEVQVELECALELQDSADAKKDASIGLAGVSNCLTKNKKSLVLLGALYLQAGFDNSHSNQSTESKKPFVGLPAWLIDSSATSHITNDISNISSPSPYNGEDKVYIGDGSFYGEDVFAGTS